MINSKLITVAKTGRRTEISEMRIGEFLDYARQASESRVGLLREGSAR
jgi:hypothetical protein